MTTGTEWAPPEEFDDYVIDRPLGSGRVGKVYLAQDAVLARPVAVKFIAGCEPDAETRQRFLLEARAAARIQHPNVVTIYRVGELEQQPYIVTEFVRGQTLDKLERPLPRDAAPADRLDAGPRPGGRPPPRRAARRHQARQRDPSRGRHRQAARLRPGRHGRGQRRLGGGTQPGATRGTTGISGTPDYMAPEVWRGEPADRRSDVYSLGALLYELAAGATPFHDVAALSDLPRVVQERDAPPLAGAPGVDARLAAIVDRCLARDPAERFASADELRDALEELERVGADGADRRAATRTAACARSRPSTARCSSAAARRSARSSSGCAPSRSCWSPATPASASRRCAAPACCPRSPRARSAAGGPGRGRSSCPGARPLRGAGRRAGRALGARRGDAAAALLARPRPRSRDALRAAARRRARPAPLRRPARGAGHAGATPRRRAPPSAALARLAAGVPGVRLLATVRGDFLARLAALPALGDELPRALYFLRPLAPDAHARGDRRPGAGDRRRASSPRRWSTSWSSTTAQAEGGLPLLQFALAELWEARDAERRRHHRGRAGGDRRRRRRAGAPRRHGGGRRCRPAQRARRGAC